MLARLVALALPLLGAANAVLSITYPSAETVWYTNNTVLLNWTSSVPAADTYLFSVELGNAAGLLSANQSLAQSINATADFVRLLLPSLTSGSGYVVSIVNATDAADVLATSPQFSIQQGAAPSSTTSSGAASSTSAGAIPNAVSTSSVVFPTASAAASASASANKASSAEPRALGASHVLGVVAAALVGALVA